MNEFVITTSNINIGSNYFPNKTISLSENAYNRPLGSHQQMTHTTSVSFLCVNVCSVHTLATHTHTYKSCSLCLATCHCNICMINMHHPGNSLQIPFSFQSHHIYIRSSEQTILGGNKINTFLKLSLFSEIPSNGKIQIFFFIYLFFFHLN